MTRLHDGALKAAAKAVHQDRYLMHTVSDEDLATTVLETYYENKPDRRRQAKSAGKPKRQPVTAADVSSRPDYPFAE